MKPKKRIYFILSYVFFILPPFIWGLVELYLERAWKVHIVSLIVNVIVLLILAIVLGLLVYYKKLHVPSNQEQKQLLFGLIGNIVVYFYTFQGGLNMENIVTIYLILLIILIVRYFLLSKTITNYELWILLPIFLIIDTVHYLLTGCAVMNTSSGYCIGNDVNIVVLYILYTIIVISILGYYIYKVYLYQRWTFFGITNMVLVTFVSIFTQEAFNVDEKFFGTLLIALAFFVILDFIVSIVNKTYTHRTLLFYIRTTTIFVTFMILSENGFFTGNAGRDMLVLMVMATYVSFGIMILKAVLNIQEEADITIQPSFHLVPLTESLRQDILSQYGKIAFDHMEMDSYSIVALKEDTIIGFISTYVKQLSKPLEELQEAYINIIEVHKEHRLQGVAKALIQNTEKHFEKLGITQIRAWSSEDKVEAIHMWKALGFNLSPATIYINENVHVDGYYVVKSL